MKEKNYQKAIEYYEKAAAQNHAGAQFGLGWMYEKGEGVEKDYQKALEYYKQSGYEEECDRLYKMLYNNTSDDCNVEG